MNARKTRSSSTPTKMNGRLRPKREIERSLSSPMAGCTSMAMSSPAVLIVPRAVLRMASGAKAATR